MTMIRKLFSSVRALGGLTLSIVMLAGYVYYSQQAGLLRPVAPKPVPQALDTAVNEVCREVTTQLPEPGRALKPTLLLPLNSDREGIFTDRLRSTLDHQGWYRPVDASLLDKTLTTVRELTGIGADPSDRSMQWTADELANMMCSAKAETVLRGSVDRLALPVAGPVEISLRIEHWELSATEPVTAVLISALHVEWPLTTSTVSGMSHWNGLRQYGAALLIALVWPFAMIPWMRRAIREDSNTAILKTLLGITAIPVLVFLAYLLWQGKSGLNIALQGITAALFLFFYTAFVLNGVQNKIK